MPAAVDQFVGRSELLERVQQRLTTSRLVTLYGVGGGGKTRLAFEIAAQAEQSREYEDGVWIADLTTVKDQDMLVQTILSAVDAPDQSTRRPRDTLTKHLQDKRLLLVLDNCEHLMPAPSKLAISLLERAPHLRILATSRAPLGIRGEAVEPVEPMAVPPIDAPMPTVPYEHSEYEAVQLFWTIVDKIVPGWRITETTWPQVLQLLRLVDGIPLAIELAAKRLRSMSLGTLVARMGDMFKVLNKNGDAPMHHETLEAVFDLNRRIFGDPQNLLWARVSTFGGTFTLHAAEEICADDQLSRDEVADALADLVEYSVVATTASRTRYRLLTPLQQYGANLLAERGEQELLREKHRDYYLGLAANAAATWYQPDEFRVLGELADDLDNCRAVMHDYVVRPDPAQTGLQMAVDLARLRLFFLIGEMREAISWLGRTVEATPEPNSQLELAARSLDLFIDLCIGADEHLIRPRLTRLEEAVAGLGPVPPVWFAIGVGKLWLDEDLGGVPLLEDAYAAFRAAGSESHGDAAMAMLIKGVGEALMADEHQASAAASRLTTETERAGAPWMIRWAYWCEAIVEMRFREPVHAVERIERLLREQTDVDDNWLIMWLVEVLAWATAKTGAARRAAVLLGVSSELHDRTGVRVEKLLPFARHRSNAETAARKMLGPRAYDEAFAYGKAFHTDQMSASGTRVRRTAAARERALEESAEQQFDIGESPWRLLTSREQDVAKLVGQGKTNDEIADSLVNSVRTVDAHLRSIRAKLGITDRVKLATWARDQDPAHKPSTPTTR